MSKENKRSHNKRKSLFKKIDKILNKKKAGSYSKNCANENTQNDRISCNNVISTDIKNIKSKYNVNCDSLSDIITFFNNKSNIKLYKKELSTKTGEANIYLTQFEDKNIQYPIIIKQYKQGMMSNKKALKETFEEAKYISEFILNNDISPHFIYCYDMIECSDTYMFLYEKADGDLSQMFQNKIFDFSIFEQIIICIFTLHQACRIYHMDANSDNFLYINLKTPTYLIYKFNNKFYKIKTKYIVTNWDFANASMDKRNVTFSSFRYGTYFLTLWNDYMLTIFEYCYYVVENYNEKYVSKKDIKCILDIITLIDKFNREMFNNVSHIKNHKEQVDYILEKEKEFLNTLIQNKLIFKTTKIINTKDKEIIYNTNKAYNLNFQSSNTIFTSNYYNASKENFYQDIKLPENLKYLYQKLSYIS